MASFFEKLFGQKQPQKKPQEHFPHQAESALNPLVLRLTLEGLDKARQQGSAFDYYKRQPELASHEGVSQADIKEGFKHENNLDHIFRGESERELPVRTLVFDYFQYGKCFPNGPDAAIQSGMEHQNIAASEGHDPNLEWQALKRLVNHHKSLWELSYEFYSSHPDYPGAIIKHNFTLGGRDYVAVTRPSFRHEGGQQMTGTRRFTTAETIIIPAEQWSLAVIPQLHDVMSAPSRKTKEFNLPKVEVSTAPLDETLPDQWLSPDIINIVKRVLNGDPVSQQTTNLNAEENLQTIYRALLCLPESISHQISFASGAAAMSGETRLAFGETVNTRNRPDSPLVAAYCTEVMPRLANCRTGRECLAVLAELQSDKVREIEQAVWSQ